jgi:hypothetical protein
VIPLLGLLLLLTPQSHAADPKREDIRGICALILKLGEWTERITMPVSEAAKGKDLNLSEKKTFTYKITQPDGSEVTHEGLAPPQIRGFNVRISFDQDDKIGWASHEEMTSSFTLYDRKNRARVEGPYRGSVIRKLDELRETTEDLPFVSGIVRIGGEKLEFRFGCSKALGT